MNSPGIDIESMDATNGAFNPWEVHESLFPEGASVKDHLRFLLHYAILAPSIHNSQPWLYRISENDVAIMADRSRALPVVDPDDRSLIMSCGAALMNLRVALSYFGYKPSVKIFPDLSEPDLLAFVSVGERMAPKDGMRDLFRAITKRRTIRKTFEDRAISRENLLALQECAAQEGATFSTVTRKDLRRELASLVSEADRRQREDKSFRRELASWIHPNRSRSRDGLPRIGTKIRDSLTGTGPLVVRTFDTGDGTAATEEHIATGSPVIGVLSTSADRSDDWLAAGQALERILLFGTSIGLSFSFLNQPIEMAKFRSRIAGVIESNQMPQTILRIGYSRRTRPSPRRTLTEVIVHPGFNP